MATREFSAPDGTTWQAWTVIPGEQAEWPAAARRHLPEALAHGWLCFESTAGKRRLSPIPDDWDRGTEGELWSFCLRADPVRRK
jgi:hypothetical protein